MPSVSLIRREARDWIKMTNPEGPAAVRARERRWDFAC
jgi:hypothetical protein